MKKYIMKREQIKIRSKNSVCFTNKTLYTEKSVFIDFYPHNVRRRTSTRAHKQNQENMSISIF